VREKNNSLYTVEYTSKVVLVSYLACGDAKELICIPAVRLGFI
jgi:hypothetical protein